MEDQFASLEVIIFEEVLNRVQELLQGDAPLLVKGVLEFPTQEEPKIRAESITKLVTPQGEEKLYLKISDANDGDLLNRVLYILDQYAGDIPVYMFFSDTKALRLMERFPVRVEPRLLEQLQDMLGEDSVVLKTVNQQQEAE